MNITIKDVKDYIKDLEILRDYIIENKDFMRNYDLQLELYNKWISYFKNKLEEIKGDDKDE